MFEDYAEDMAELAAVEEPADEPPADDANDDGEDFWDSYTTWLDEELARQAGNSGSFIQ